MTEVPGIVLRPAGADDRERLLEWRNDPDVRAGSSDRAEVSEERHKRWFAHALRDPRRHLLVAEVEGEPMGVVRFDWLRSGRYEISVTLKRGWRGRGLGTNLIRAGTDWLWRETDAHVVDAQVLTSNAASLRAFRRAGFRDRADIPPPGLAWFVLTRPRRPGQVRVLFLGPRESPVRGLLLETGDEVIETSHEITFDWLHESGPDLLVLHMYEHALDPDAYELYSGRILDADSILGPDGSDGLSAVHNAWLAAREVARRVTGNG